MGMASRAREEQRHRDALAIVQALRPKGKPQNGEAEMLDHLLTSFTGERLHECARLAWILGAKGRMGGITLEKLEQMQPPMWLDWSTAQGLRKVLAN